MDYTCFITQKIPTNYTNNFIKLSRCIYISYTKISREHVYIISNFLIMCKPLFNSRTDKLFYNEYQILKLNYCDTYSMTIKICINTV